MTYKEIRKNEEVRAYLKKGNENLGVLGFTDHSEVHCALVAERAAYILKKLDYTEHDIELAKIAALIIADKTDVRRNRVRDKEPAAFDIHDRVNYAVTEAKLKVNKEKMTIALNLQIDENICTMFEYFDIFLGRMMMCRGAAEILGARFKLTANGSKVL